MSLLFSGVRRITLRTLLVLPFTLQILGVGGWVGYMSYQNGQRTILHLADHFLAEVGDRVTEKLNNDLSLPKKLNQMNGQAIASGLLNPNNYASLEKYFSNQQQSFPLRAISYHQPNEAGLGVRVLPGGTTIVERSQPKPETLYGRTYWRAIAPADNATTKIALALHTPVLDRTQNLIGEIEIEIALEGLNHFLSTLKIGQGQIWVVERSGAIIARSTPQPPSPSRDRVLQATLRSLKERALTLTTVQTPQQLRLPIEGQPQFVRLIPYRDEYGLDWIIAIAIPESEFAPEINANSRNTFILCLVALVIALLTSLLTANWVAAPFLRLNQAAKEMAQGDLKKTFPSSRVQELDDLAESLDGMAKHIQKSFAALRESEAELTQFLQALPIAAIAIDQEAQPHYVNPRAVEILGIDIALKTAPETFSQIYQIYKAGTIEHYPWEDLPLARALQGQSSYIDDAEIHRSNEAIFIEAWGTPIYDTQGTIAYALVAFQDITQRKQAEKMLAEYNKFLEERVESRTQELAAKNLELEETLRELRRAEQAARESEVKFAGIVRIAEDAIISVDEQQRIQLFNRGAEKIFGYAAEDVIGEPLDILLPREVRAIHRQHLHHFGSGLTSAYRGMGKIDRGPIRGRRKNGEEFPAEASISKLNLKNGNIYTVILNDISERQRIEAALRQSEKQFRSAFETAAIGVGLISPEGKFLEVNVSLCEMLGYSEAELLVLNFEEITYLEDLETDFQYIQQALSGQIRSYDTEKRYWHKNGSLIWARETAALVRDENDRPLYFITQIQNVSVRKATEAALREKEEYLRLILDNIPQQVFWKDTHLIFQGCNANWARAAGLENSQAIVGKTDYDLLPEPHLAKAFRDRDRQIIESGMPELHVVAEKVRPGKDGQTIWLDVNKMPIRNAQGKVVGILGVLEDITLRKQAEEALHLEQQKSESLLRNILPEAIVEQLKQDQSAIAEQFENVTILFADIVGFTPLAASMSPTALVDLLNQIFSRFDALAEVHGLEKIKTIGDAYLAVGGLPRPKPDHAEAVAEMALGMRDAIANFSDLQGQALSLRVGINTGSVVAGVIGQKKFIYDLWGDAVNIASRMEASGLPGRIQVTAQTYPLLQEHYEFEQRGIVPVRGRGDMMTYWLLGRKAQNSDVPRFGL